MVHFKYIAQTCWIYEQAENTRELLTAIHR